MAFIKVISLGTIISDIKFGGEEGSEYCSFILAAQRKFKKKDEEYASSVTIPAKCFGKTAVFINKYFSKLSTISIIGDLEKDDDYTNNEGNVVEGGYYINIREADFTERKNGNSDSENTENVENAAKSTSNEPKSPFKATASAAPAKSPFAAKLNKIGK